MLHKIGLRKRFFVILTLISVCSLPIMLGGFYIVLKKNIDAETFEKARFYLSTIESVRKQIGKVTRPAVTSKLPNDFIREAMSSSFNARGVAERVQEEFTEYSFRHTSLNPRYNLNKADAFESELIRNFRNDRNLKQLSGHTQKGGKEYFYIAKPVVSDASCLQCHGDPKDAPREVLENYGGTAAFGWIVNDVVASLVVYVPTEIAVHNALRSLLIFGCFFAVIYFITFLIIDRVIVLGIINPIQQLVDTAAAVSTGSIDREFVVKSNDEILVLAEAFNRMKKSLKMAMKMLQKQ